MILYRPVGTSELELIKESGYTSFPPRLSEQPIFYPVLNEEYACEIAEKWNTKTNDGKGYVTRFAVDDDYRIIRVWLLKENKRADRFYQKCGFAPDGNEKLSKVGAVGIRMTLDRSPANL